MTPLSPLPFMSPPARKVNVCGDFRVVATIFSLTVETSLVNVHGTAL